MILKPSPVQAAVVDEAIDAALQAEGHDEYERELLRDFKSSLEQQK